MYTDQTFSLLYYFADKEAGDIFKRAAELSESTDLLETVGLYEQAALCAKMANELQTSLKMYNKALAICDANKRHLKCALLSDSIATIVLDKDEKIDYLRQSAEYYEKLEDRRASQAHERIAHLYGELSKYDKAEKYYQKRADVLNCDPLLINMARRNLLFALCCRVKHIGSTKDAADVPEWFEGSEEHRALIQWCNEWEFGTSSNACNYEFPSFLLQQKNDLC